LQDYKRLVGIDVGAKRTGIAQTDLLKTIATPVGTFPTTETISELEKLVSQTPVEAFIVGWPLTPRGEIGESAERVKTFTKELSSRIPQIPVIMFDETGTSVEAVQRMVQAGVSKKKRRQKGRVDRIAAALILQRYLEQQT
jgi:putative Holliday junction resolvase